MDTQGDQASKACRRCKAEKPLDQFNRHPRTKDGRQPYCKPCAQAYVRDWEASNAERLAARRAAALAEPVDPTKTKHCPGCDQDKPLLEFHAHRSTRDRRATYCKPCALEYDKTVRGKARAEYAKGYNERNRVRVRENMRAFRLRLYGLTPEQYGALVAEQHGRCAICRERPPASVDNRPRLVIDHDHETNHFRALLCNACNAGLGMFADDPARLRAAADYLDAHR